MTTERILLPDLFITKATDTLFIVHCPTEKESLTSLEVMIDGRLYYSPFAGSVNSEDLPDWFKWDESKVYGEHMAISDQDQINEIKALIT